MTPHFLKILHELLEDVIPAQEIMLKCRHLQDA